MAAHKQDREDFPFTEDKTSDVPLWMQLRQRLVYLIETGYYRPGDKLPTVRGLAADININYNTVNKAYLSLASDGFIESTRGRGAFVLDLPTRGDDDLARQADALVDDFLAACRQVGLSYDDIQNCVSRRISRLKYEESDDGAHSRNVVDIRRRGANSAEGA